MTFVLLSAKAPTGGLEKMWNVRSEPAPQTTWLPQRHVTVRPGVVASVDEFTNHDEHYSVWALPATAAHGAIAVGYEGLPTTRWNDAAVTELVTGLLDAPSVTPSR